MPGHPVTRWQIRRTGWHRWEARPLPSCITTVVYGTAAGVVALGVAVRAATVLLAWARGHTGIVALAGIGALLLAATLRRR